MHEVVSRLLAWFRSSARDLPWRGPFPRDPYRVLVSEVMLQQTQVDRVIQPYLRFMERFPTVVALAAAREEDVLLAFSGLGYYGRARRLRAAARTVVERGAWPRDRDELARLPGFGPYTSAAVAAFAFDGTAPPVDGNVERIAARRFASAERVGSAALRRTAIRLASEVHRCAPIPDVFEALMELGASVCSPVQPDCPTCPLSPVCVAGRQGNPRSYPLPRRTRASEDHRWIALWVEHPDCRVLLVPAPEGSLLAGLYLPPLRYLTDHGDPDVVADELAESLGIPRPIERVGAVRHGITHRRITVFVYRARDTDTRMRVGEPGRERVWEDPLKPGVATSTLTGKIRDLCNESGPQTADETKERP